MFNGLLSIVERCALCGLPLRAHEKGDGPSFFAITIVGFIVTALAFYVEFTYEPPFWVHALLWGPLVLMLSVYNLRLFKALLIRWQYQVHPEDFEDQRPSM